MPKLFKIEKRTLEFNIKSWESLIMHIFYQTLGDRHVTSGQESNISETLPRFCHQGVNGIISGFLFRIDEAGCPR